MQGNLLSLSLSLPPHLPLPPTVLFPSLFSSFSSSLSPREGSKEHTAHTLQVQPPPGRRAPPS